MTNIRRQYALSFLISSLKSSLDYALYLAEKQGVDGILKNDKDALKCMFEMISRDEWFTESELNTIHEALEFQFHDIQNSNDGRTNPVLKAKYEKIYGKLLYLLGATPVSDKKEITDGDLERQAHKEYEVLKGHHGKLLSDEEYFVFAYIAGFKANE